MQHRSIQLAQLGLKFVAVSIVLLSPAAFAVDGGGCTDSPENPTAVLGLLGGGAASIPWLRARFALIRHARASAQRVV